MGRGWLAGCSCSTTRHDHRAPMSSTPACPGRHHHPSHGPATPHQAAGEAASSASGACTATHHDRLVLMPAGGWHGLGGVLDAGAVFG